MYVFTATAYAPHYRPAPPAPPAGLAERVRIWRDLTAAEQAADPAATLQAAQARAVQRVNRLAGRNEFTGIKGLTLADWQRAAAAQARNDQLAALMDDDAPLGAF